MQPVWHSGHLGEDAEDEATQGSLYGQQDSGLILEQSDLSDLLWSGK